MEESESLTIQDANPIEMVQTKIESNPSTNPNSEEVWQEDDDVDWNKKKKQIQIDDVEWNETIDLD